MDGFWNFLAKFFEAIFSVMTMIGPWFNKLLIVIGFVAFFLWVGYMSRQKETEKFD
jgi:hypothetical protein